MDDQSLSSELVHLTCTRCKRVTSLSYGSLLENNVLECPYCGQTNVIDLQVVKQDAQRQAQELDESFDSLGSLE